MSVTIGLGTPWPGPGLSHTSLGQNPYPKMLLAPRNNVELSREMLITVLEHLSTAIASEFSGMPIRLVAHGGACMLLHPGFNELANRKAMHHAIRGENVSRRTTTRDVDYIHRSFITESESRGIINAGERLKKCVQVTALRYQLGADWMNSDADVALPMSSDPNTGVPFDPIYVEAVKEDNIRLYTVFTSSNKLLTIINVTPFWAVALKLVRYTKWDPGDICLLLLYGSVTRRVHWTAQSLEGWIRVNCSAMNYHNWVSSRIMDMRQKIGHAAALLSSIGSSIMAQPGDPLFFSNQPGSRSFYSLGASTETHHPTHSTSSVVMPATVGIPWAGPASDALSAQSSGVELERAYSSFWSGLEKDDGLNPESQSLVTTPAASTKEQKRNARRGTKDWINEQEEHMKRRSKYMLRAEEPDDSDDTDIGNDTDCDEPIARGVRHGGAPIIPMERRSNSVPTLLDAPPLHHWRSNSALLSNHSWTNSKSRGQIP